MNIAIVGAGITGSRLANLLADQGHAITVFEKSRGKGGRATRKRLSWADCDLGACVIPCFDDSFHSELLDHEQRGLADTWPQTEVVSFDGETLKPWCGGQSQTHFYVFSPGMNAVCQHWLQGVEVKYQTRVHSLKRNGEGWQLLTEDNLSFGNFDRVFVTVPLPQAPQLVAAHITGSPAQDTVKWASCWSVACALNKPIENPHQLIYLSDQDIQSIALDSSKPGRRQEQQVWVIQFSHGFSDKNPKATEQSLVDRCVSTLEQIYGVSELVVENAYCHYWRFARPAHKAEPVGLLKDAEAGLYCGGDWSIGGSVQSAFIAAEQLYNAFKQR